MIISLVTRLRRGWSAVSSYAEILAPRADAVTAPRPSSSEGMAKHHASKGMSTMTSAQPVPPIGQAVGQAEASLTKLLLGILAESGTSHDAYIGLQRLNTLGGEAAADAYQRDLGDWLE